MQVLNENRRKGKLQQGEIQKAEEMLLKEPIIEAAKESLSYKLRLPNLFLNFSTSCM
jgi:hypothetical protein